jgi:isopentenyl-diphosphate delta-isomerase
MAAEEQMLLLVDEAGNFTGKYEKRSVCHTGKGRRHLAFVMLVYNKDRKILLQHRKHAIFDDMWDLAGASHPLHMKDKDETMQEAADRFLKNEWGVPGLKVDDILGFNYFAQYGEKCENEHCRLLVAEHNGKFEPSGDHAYGFKWISLDDLVKDIIRNPKSYTPWLVVAVEELLKHPLAKELK